MFNNLKTNLRNLRNRFRNAQEGAVEITHMVYIAVGVLVFAALGPAIASGLNSTVAAFTGFPGVGSLVQVAPLLLVVVVLFTLIQGRK